MPTIHVPIEAHKITLNINGTLRSSSWDEAQFRTVLRTANGVWRRAANIVFDLNRFTTDIAIELLNANSSFSLIDADQQYILSRLPGQRVLNIVLVENLRQATSVGGVQQEGAAVENLRCCLLAFNADYELCGVTLAHELGHLLGLNPHYVQRPSDPPGNLMTALADRFNTYLVQRQVSTAQAHARRVATAA